MSNEPMVNDVPEDSQAYRDFILWEKYQEWCSKLGVKPGLDDFLIWLEDNDKE